MKINVKKILYGLIVIVILIQLVPIDRENPSSDEALEITAPPEVKTILKNSCYDCHSNKTNWPFYSYIAPVSWLVAKDVNKGREELNFSEWEKLSAKEREKKKEDIMEEITGNDMPLPIYLITHSGAELNDEQKQIIKNWAGE